LKKQVKKDATPERKHTLESFVNKYAPSIENSTNEYINYFVNEVNKKAKSLNKDLVVNKDTSFNTIVSNLGESEVAKIISKKEDILVYNKLEQVNFFENKINSTLSNTKPNIKKEVKVKPTSTTNNNSTTLKSDDRIDEFKDVVKREGLLSALMQTWNYFTNSPKEGNVSKPKEIILDNKKNITKEPKTPTLKLLSDTIKDKNDNDRIYVGFSINANDNYFGFRNRKDESDIKTKAAVAHTYNQFRKADEYVGKIEPGFGDKNGKNTLNDYVIALNTKTGKIETGVAKNFNNDYVLSRTLPPKRIKDIEVNMNAPKNKNLNNKKTITLVKDDGSKTQGMIAFGSTGYEMGQAGYDGGKILITTPDNKHTQLIYGSAQDLKKELNNFKKVYNVEYVNFYDLDQKAFAQAVQTKSGVISKDLARSLDNTNSSGGNFLYLK
jgi:hypothetical protein